MTMTQVPIPTALFGRWMVRAGVHLPVPMSAMCVANLGLPPEELNELAPHHDEVVSAERAAKAEGLSAAATRAVIEFEPFARNAELVLFVSRMDHREVEITAGGLICGDRAAILVDGEEDVRVGFTDTPLVAEALVSVVPQVRGAVMPRIELSEAALLALGDPALDPDRAATKVASASGIPRESIAAFQRVQQGTRAGGMMVALRPTDVESLAPAGADWYESPHGALLKQQLPDGRFRFESADRPRLVSTLASLVAQAS